ncbi:hypothetical protein A45J_0395 [hot springs metagenome]|uniref:ArsR family transcriptional regulator n=1 Tax=hot springs metagenome TaxID=433727 RepID=A0A5J4L1N7_9ZZZZ
MEPKKERYRRIRGAILKLLAHQHPGTLDDKVLYWLLDDLRYSCSDEEYESHIAYLAEERLMHVERRKTGGVEIRMFKISTKGLNVLDGFITDPGVDANF